MRARRAGRRAQEVWSQLPAVIDGRWRARLGPAAVDRLERALGTVFGGLPIDPPAYLPVDPSHPGRQGRDTPPTGRRRRRQPPRSHRAARSRRSSAGSWWPSRSTSSRRHGSRCPSAPTPCACSTASGTRIGDLPRLTGVSREANAMCAGWLERHGCAVTEPDTHGDAGARCSASRRRDRRRSRSTTGCWAPPRSRGGRGTAPPPSTTSGPSLEHVVGDGTFASSPLAPGLVPYPDNWRARVRPPRDAPAPPDGAAPRRLPRWQLRAPVGRRGRMWQAGTGAPLSPRRRVATPRRRGVRRAGGGRRGHRRRRRARRRQPRPEDRPRREGRLRVGHVVEVVEDDPRRHPLPPAT